MRGEIFIAVWGTDALEILVHRFGKRALIENIAATLGNFDQGQGKVWVLEDFTLCRGFATGHIGAAHIVDFLDHAFLVQRLETGSVALPILGNKLADRETLLRVTNARSKNRPHRQLAETPVHFEPAVNRSRNRNRSGAPVGNCAIGIAHRTRHFLRPVL